MTPLEFAFTAVVVYVGCIGTYYVVVEDKGLLDLHSREFSDDLFRSCEAL